MVSNNHLIFLGALIKDKCLTREKGEVEEIFLQDFGKKPEEMLRRFEPEPVAAASLAQVLKMKYRMSQNIIHPLPLYRATERKDKDGN